jgi:hypothetical protein
LGSEVLRGHNRLFRYAKNGSGALVVGTVVQATPPNDSHKNMVCAAQSVGKTDITVTLAYGDPIAKDEYKQGYLYVNDQGTSGTGAGHIYEVKDHEHGGGEDSTKKITIYDNVVVALTTASQATLVRNPYWGVFAPLGSPFGMVMGATPVAVPANHYFWLQVRGPCPVLQYGNLWEGRGVMVSQGRQGGVEVLKQVIPIKRESAGREWRADMVSTEALQFQQEGVEMGKTYGEDYLTKIAGKATIPERCVGYCINPSVSTEHALIYLTLS